MYREVVLLSVGGTQQHRLSSRNGRTVHPIKSAAAESMLKGSIVTTR
jgi:hypothetical protein